MTATYQIEIMKYLWSNKKVLAYGILFVVSMALSAYLMYIHMPWIVVIIGILLMIAGAIEMKRKV